MVLMDMDRFENLVNEVVDGIPHEFKEILKREKISVLPRELVPRAVKEKFPGRIVFGIFIGVPLNKKRLLFLSQTEPTRIEIYMESFRKIFGTEINEKMKEKIKDTVIHEIAHSLGFDEKEITERGY